MNENPLISPLEHVVSANVPRDRWDRKSLDEGAHYLGKRWQGVRVAEYLPSSSGIGRFCFWNRSTCYLLAIQNRTILTIHVSWCKRTNWNLIRYYHAGGGGCENNCNHVHRWLFWVPFLRCNIAIEASMWFQQLLGGKGVITHHPTVTFTSWSPGFDLCDYSRHQI